MTQTLIGQVAVVTGGARGIGEGIARKLAAHGARVVVAGRRRAPLEKVAAEIGGLAVVTDVADETQVAALFAACQRSHGRLDVLVNNAGLGGAGPEAAEALDMAAWDRMFAVNVRGTALCIKYAVPLLKQRGGTIVNVASIAAFRPNPGRSCYAATKAAMMSITRSMSLELGPAGIRVNAICPGAVDTEMMREIAAAGTTGAERDRTIEKQFRHILERSALGRMATVEDIAEGVLYLASAASGAMTGQHLRIDGGRQ